MNGGGRTMNIWILNHYATTPEFTGGTRHYDLARELVERGHRVTIIASSFNHFSKKETVKYAKESYLFENVNGVQFMWIKTPPYKGIAARLANMAAYTAKALKYGRILADKEAPDIIIGSSVHPLAALAGLRIAKRCGAAFYFEERDLWPQTFIDFGKLSANSPATRLLYKLESYLYRNADRTIVLFSKAVGYATSRGVAPEKAVHLPNGVDLSRFERLEPFPEVDRLAAKLSGKFIIAYCGSHGLANHLQPMLDLAEETAKLNSSIHILSVGAGAEKPALMQEAKERGLDNITFADPLPKKSIPYLLSKVDMSYISLKNSPLYKWGFSMNKLFDYMAAGLPIVMNCPKELADEIRESGGIISSEDPRELAENIQFFHNNRDLMKDMSLSLKEYVHERHSWTRLCDVLEEKMLADCRQEMKIHETVI